MTNTNTERATARLADLEQAADEMLRATRNASFLLDGGRPGEAIDWLQRVSQACIEDRLDDAVRAIKECL